MKIKKLSSDIQLNLRTGVTITDTSQCVAELVQNSLDAQSTSIAVRIDLDSFTIQVIDNGFGLTQEELDMIGARYMTSKCHSLKDFKTNLKYYGFRGEALASLRESSAVLMIMSKHKDSDQTYSKVFRGQMESQAKISTRNRFCAGTTVVVKDFLCNLPVRKSRIQPAIEIEHMRHTLQALSIINHKVSFTLRNDVTKAVVLQTQKYKNTGEALKHHCNLKENHSLIPVSMASPPFQISGHISRETEQLNDFQYIYVNKRLIKNKDLYKLVSKRLSKSFYLRNVGKEVKVMSEKPKEKALPVFVINIQCPYSEYDISSEPKKITVEFRKWDIVMKCLENLIDTFVSTEMNLTTVLQQSPERPKENLNMVQTLKIAEENLGKSNVMYGISVKRSHMKTKTSKNKRLIPSKISTTPHFHDKDLTSLDKGRKNGKENGCTVSSEADSTVLYKRPCGGKFDKRILAPESIEESNKIVSSDSIFKSDLENPFPFKVPRQAARPLKKRLSEHIITESESDSSPVKKKCGWDSSVSKVRVKCKRSILPITSQEFFTNAISNISLSRDILFHCDDICSNSFPDQALQIDFYRSVKKVPNSNSLKVSQQKTVKYLDCESGHYFDCCEGTQTTIINKINELGSMENLIDCENRNNKTTNIRELTTAKPLETDKEKKTIKRSQWINTSNILRGQVNKTSNLKNNCNLFRTLKKTNHTNRYKSLHINKSKDTNMKQKQEHQVVLLKSVQDSPYTQNLLKRETNQTKHHLPFAPHQDLKRKHLNMSRGKIHKLRLPNISDSRGYDNSLKSAVIDKFSANKKADFKNVHVAHHIGNKTISFGDEEINSMQSCSNSALKNDIYSQIPLHNKIPKKENCAVKEKKHNIKTTMNNYAHPSLFSSTILGNGHTNKLSSLNSSEKISFDLQPLAWNANEKNSSVYEEKNQTAALPGQENYKNQHITKLWVDDVPETPKRCQTHYFYFSDWCKDPMESYKNSSTSDHISLSNCNNNTSSTLQNSKKIYFEKSLKDTVIIVDLSNCVDETDDVEKHCPERDQLQNLNPETNYNDFQEKLTADKRNQAHIVFQNINIPEQSDEVCVYMSLENNQATSTNDMTTYPEESENICNEVDSVEGKSQSFSLSKSFSPCCDPNKNFAEDLQVCESDKSVTYHNLAEAQEIIINHENMDLSSEHNEILSLSSTENLCTKEKHTVLLLNQCKKLPNCSGAKSGEEVVLLEDYPKSCNIPVTEVVSREDGNFKSRTNTNVWEMETTPNGSSIYIDPVTGMSSFLNSKVDFKTKYIPRNRHWFMPKGISPILQISERPERSSKQLTEEEKIIVENILEKNIPTAVKEFPSEGAEKILSILSGKDSNITYCSRLDVKKACVFSKESLSSAQVIGQVDSKFIAVLLQPNSETSMFLVLIDQHAMDERIRVEHLIAEYTQKDSQLVGQPLNPHLEVNLSENEKAMVSELLPRMLKLGLKLTMDEKKVLAAEIPQCLFNRSERDNPELLKNMVTTFVKQLIAYSGEFRSVMPTLPRFLSDIINMEACRGAIKFGDNLTLAQCKLLVSKLAQCKVPFQCAHGRPVLTSLCEMEEPECEEGPINLKRFVKQACG